MKENSIEEAIERLEYIDRTYSFNNYYSKSDLDCIGILLSEYKKILKENELAKQSLIKSSNIADERNNLLVENQKLKQENEELKKRIPSFESGTYLGDYDGLVKFQNELDKLQKENKELKSKIENKDKYFGLITGLGYDYDGYYNRETSNGNMKDLADLIDELVQAARDGLNDIPFI